MNRYFVWQCLVWKRFLAHNTNDFLAKWRSTTEIICSKYDTSSLIKTSHSNKLRQLLSRSTSSANIDILNNWIRSRWPIPSRTWSVTGTVKLGLHVKMNTLYKTNIKTYEDIYFLNYTHHQNGEVPSFIRTHTRLRTYVRTYVRAGVCIYVKCIHAYIKCNEFKGTHFRFWIS